MKARLRIIVAASAALAAAGAPSIALAQQAPAESQTPAVNDVIGPPQLQNFSLNGTVTKEAPAAAPVRPRPRPEAPDSAAADRSSSVQARPPEEPRATASAEPQTRSQAKSGSPQRAPEVRLGAPAAELAGSGLSAAGELPTSDPIAPTVATTTGDIAGSGPWLLPWIIAALALVAAAGWYFLRQRPRESFAGAGPIDLFEAPAAPAPKPVAAPAPAPAAPVPPPSPGIVSTRLRPVLEIEFTPQRAMVDDQKAAVAFELSVYNSGSGPARDVLLEASLFNAGPTQDQQIKLFFDNPVAKGDRIPMIAPHQRVTVNTAVFLPREQLRPIEVEGRPLLVPLIGFNVIYGWGRNSGQTSTSYLIGKRTDGEKLAPFRLDLGPRVFRNLEAREHELQLRK